VLLLHCNTDWCNQKVKFLQSSRKCCKAVITRAVCIYNTEDANQKQSSNALTLTLTLIFCTCLVSVAGFLASFAPVVSGASFLCCVRPGASFLLLREQLFRFSFSFLQLESSLEGGIHLLPPPSVSVCFLMHFLLLWFAALSSLFRRLFLFRSGACGSVSPWEIP
jgi:hypothetical protein